MSVATALVRAMAWYRTHGVAVLAIMTDNGSAYRSRDFRAACVRVGVSVPANPSLPAANEWEGGND